MPPLLLHWPATFLYIPPPLFFISPFFSLKSASSLLRSDIPTPLHSFSSSNRVSIWVFDIPPLFFGLAKKHGRFKINRQMVSECFSLYCNSSFYYTSWKHSHYYCRDCKSYRSWLLSYFLILFISISICVINGNICAVCLDGSPPAYHFEKGSGFGIDSWLVHMEVCFSLSFFLKFFLHKID